MTAAGSTAAYRFSVAPMLDCTDRHFRVLMRQISRRAMLYSEMVVAQALHHSKRRNKLLDFDPVEHPIALQVGGDDPALLAEAARLAQDWGYDEINLNVGCPSQKVQAGNFGACLMAEPDLVARCVEAMVDAAGDGELPADYFHILSAARTGSVDPTDWREAAAKAAERIRHANTKANGFFCQKCSGGNVPDSEKSSLSSIEDISDSDVDIGARLATSICETFVLPECTRFEQDGG